MYRGCLHYSHMSSSPCSVCCPPAPGTRIGVYRVRSAEGDWCGQRCSVRSVQSSSHLTGVCLVYTVYLYSVYTRHLLWSPHGQPALLCSSCPASGIVTPPRQSFLSPARLQAHKFIEFIYKYFKIKSVQDTKTFVRITNCCLNPFKNFIDSAEKSRFPELCLNMFYTG